MPELTLESVSKQLKQMNDTLTKAMQPRSNAQRMFAGNNDGGGFNIQYDQDRHWTEDGRIQRLAKAYDSDTAVHMLKRDHGGRPRGIGWGPALVAMAGIACPNLSKNLNYGQENLEKEYNFTTITKAKSTGVKTLSGEIRKTALAEGSGQTGGYVVPPNFLTELLTIAAEDAFIEPRAKVIPMTTRTATWPMLDITTNQGTGISPYFGGITASWQPEAAQINESEPQFRQSEWTAWDLVLYTVSSNQLLADNGIGLDALLTQLFSQAMVWFKEFAFLQGRGAGNSMPLGILNAPATIAINRSANTTFKLVDAAKMLSKLHIRSWDSATWVMHQSVLPQLIQMYANGSSGDRLVYLSATGSDTAGSATVKLPKVFLHGLPIIFTEKVPQLGTKGDVMLVDWSRYVIGNRMDLQIDVSPHVNFRTNQLAWRVIARCDGRPWLNSYITDAAGWQSSPFVVLDVQ